MVATKDTLATRVVIFKTRPHPLATEVFRDQPFRDLQLATEVFRDQPFRD